LRCFVGELRGAGEGEGDGDSAHDTARVVLPNAWARLRWLKLVVERFAAELGPLGLAVYVCLLKHANQHGRAWPKQVRMAQMLGMGRRSVCDAIQRLQRMGLVTVGKMARKKARLYTLLDPESCARGAQEGAVLCATRTDSCAPRAQLSEGIPVEGNPPLPPKGERGRLKGTDDKPAIPEPLNCADFIAAWADWHRHRRETRHPLKPTTTAAQLKKLAAWGVDRAVVSIRQSIENGWQGLFEPRPNGKAGGTAHQAEESKEQRDQRTRELRERDEQDRRRSEGAGLKGLTELLKARGDLPGGRDGQ
jgi:hypothetical protein